MKDRKVLLDTIGRETRMVVLEDGRPVEFAIERHGEARLVGNIYLGRVVNIVRGMQAAFVDIGLEKNAFLSLDDLPTVLPDLDEVRLDLQGRALRPGQEVVVQVLKEPGGSKGPRVTMNPTFPGKYTVLLPTVQAVGVSKHIQDEERRQALHDTARAVQPGSMGVIIRTAAERAEAEAIAEEVHGLSEAWTRLLERARTRKAPALLFGEGSLRERAWRDLNAVIDAQAFDDALEDKLSKLLRRTVWLDSGAYLVFDYCEAMTVIDVNSGKYTGKKNLSDTLRRLNTEAAREIARQVRLRDLGGIIVIDFVDMEEDADQDAVLSEFLEALEPDRARYHVHGFTAAGLLEMTRRPVYHPVQNALLAECPRCGGGHFVYSAEARAHALLRTIRRRRAAGDESSLAFFAPQAVADVLREIGIPDGVTLTLGAQEAGTPDDSPIWRDAFEIAPSVEGAE